MAIRRQIETEQNFTASATLCELLLRFAICRECPARPKHVEFF
jgi:hypothetical protein